MCENLYDGLDLWCVGKAESARPRRVRADFGRVRVAISIGFFAFLQLHMDVNYHSLHRTTPGYNSASSQVQLGRVRSDAAGDCSSGSCSATSRLPTHATNVIERIQRSRGALFRIRKGSGSPPPPCCKRPRRHKDTFSSFSPIQGEPSAASFTSRFMVHECLLDNISEARSPFFAATVYLR